MISYYMSNEAAEARFCRLVAELASRAVVSEDGTLVWASRSDEQRYALLPREHRAEVSRLVTHRRVSLRRLAG